ncbi:DUF1302 domain-containing protein [Endozoicomonas elysicola]|uniref:DUF1302 domain-containing protein n=1 Tax=Endozoicomonas elysicola TaxID=305900 RepID=A0A081KEP4_9GAMM|nr:DUF1302 family protein [Endozoicomonas elysicola]KEI72620.1 hypothetical protein GV64_19475 [Endozoicomonas elysicola]
MVKTIIKNPGFSPKERTPLFQLPRKSVMAAAIAASMAMPGAYALSFQPTDEITVDWDTNIGYAAAWRMEDPDAVALANNNGDDGNRNFNKGAMVNNRLSIISEAALSYRNYGAFIRGSAFYDDVYFHTNDHNSPTTSNNVSVPHNEFTQGTKDQNGKDARLLDAFVYGDFDIAGRNLNLRVGRQMVSWGESLFIPGISGAMSPADGTKANVPGVEVKDVLLPVGQVFAQFDLTNDLSISAYSQWEWEKTDINGAGSFFSLSDILDEGGESLFIPNLGSVQRNDDIAARDSGQWGVALNYFAEGLGNGMDLGLYYINYHDKQPSMIFDTVMMGPFTVPTGYHLEYFEDIKMIGASFGTLVGNTNIGGEVSMRKDAAVRDPNSVPMKADILQAQLSAVHAFGVTPVADDIMFSGEVGVNRVQGLKDNEMSGEKMGSGLGASVTLKYTNVMVGTNFEVPIKFSANFRGDSAGGKFTNTENTDRLSLGGKLIYQGNLETSLIYTAYFGDYEDNQYTDRDYLAFNVKYAF